MNNKIKNAFSLVELSIVLIIIGLLVAGVTSGQSLIESAKIRAVINEINGLKQGIFAFYVAEGRLPGDLNRDGMTGLNSNESYTSTSFSSPYNVDGITASKGPFIDMFLKNTYDFEPDITKYDDDGGLPLSKIFKKSYYVITNNSGSKDGFLGTLRAKSLLIVLFSDFDPSFTPELYKKVDMKLDDGIHNSGSVRGGCYTDQSALGSLTYEDAIDKDARCSEFCYNTGL